jgi:hypothetical protein
MYSWCSISVPGARALERDRTPTADWTVQQFRAFVTGDEPYGFVIHDRDVMYSSAGVRALASMHLNVITTPVRTPQANALRTTEWHGVS